MAADQEREEGIAWAGSEGAKCGIPKEWPLRSYKEMRWMINRLEELQRAALRKSIKMQKTVKASKHGYVGVYEDFLKA